MSSRRFEPKVTLKSTSNIHKEIRRVGADCRGNKLRVAPGNPLDTSPAYLICNLGLGEIDSTLGNPLGHRYNCQAHNTVKTFRGE